MEIRSHTEFWENDRSLFALGDFQLPFKISFKAIGVFVATAIPWMGLLWLLKVPFDITWWWTWFSLPAILAWFSSKRIFEGKKLMQYLSSRVKFVVQSDQYKNLRSWNDADQKDYRVKAISWKRA